MASSHLLLIEDNRSISMALAQALKNDYQIDTAATGKLAIYKTDTCTYDIIVLDLNLPDLHGLEVCQQLRERGVTTPILVLSGDAKVLTKIHLLDAGANDYLTKPFSLGELKARLRNMIRTIHSNPTKHTLKVDDLSLNPDTFEVRREGRSIDLRRKEFAILECLMRNAGVAVTRPALTRSVWPEADELWTNTMEVHIKHLRDKIDKPFERPLIKTLHGIGYKIEGISSSNA